MIPEQIQIGWFNPSSNRFCYMDEKNVFDRKQDYTWPVYAVSPEQKVVCEIRDKKMLDLLKEEIGKRE